LASIKSYPKQETNLVFKYLNAYFFKADIDTVSLKRDLGIFTLFMNMERLVMVERDLESDGKVRITRRDKIWILIAVAVFLIFFGLILIFGLDFLGFLI
jgi:hypothetical protein